jgi:phosphoribosylformylglycinamidine (FGAM) synthase-like enzyme
VGVVDSLDHVTRATFSRPGDAIVLLGENTDELGASEYLSWIHGIVAGAPPRCDLAAHAQLIDALLDAIAAGYVASAHDTSEGGLAVALAECAMGERDALLGAEVDLSAWAALPLRALLFGEAQGRVVVSTPAPEQVLAVAQRHGVPAAVIGTVTPASTGLSIKVRDQAWTADVRELAAAFHDAIPQIMSQPAAQAPAGQPTA